MKKNTKETKKEPVSTFISEGNPNTQVIDNNNRTKQSVEDQDKQEEDRS